MRLTHFLTSSLLAGSLVAMPGLSLAAPAARCAGAPAASGTAASAQEVSSLLDTLQMDTHKISLQADDFQSMLKGVNVSWESFATGLNNVRDRINDMGARLCRLENLRGTAAPWQQKAIDAAASRLQLMADNTQDAITFLNHHRDDLWMPQFERYVNNLSNEANQVEHEVHECQVYAKVHREDQNLGRSLGIAAGE